MTLTAAAVWDARNRSLHVWTQRRPQRRVPVLQCNLDQRDTGGRFPGIGPTPIFAFPYNGPFVTVNADFRASALRPSLPSLTTAHSSP